MVTLLWLDVWEKLKTLGKLATNPCWWRRCRSCDVPLWVPPLSLQLVTSLDSDLKTNDESRHLVVFFQPSYCSVSSYIFRYPSPSLANRKIKHLTTFSLFVDSLNWGCAICRCFLVSEDEGLGRSYTSKVTCPVCFCSRALYWMRKVRVAPLPSPP